MGMNLSSYNFYPPEGVISVCLVSQAVSVCCGLAAGNQRRKRNSPLLLLEIQCVLSILFQIYGVPAVDAIQDN